MKVLYRWLGIAEQRIIANNNKIKSSLPNASWVVGFRWKAISGAEANIPERKMKTKKLINKYFV